MIPIADQDNALRKLAPYIRSLDMALCGKEITTYLDLTLATAHATRAEVAWEYHSEPEADLEFSWVRALSGHGETKGAWGNSTRRGRDRMRFHWWIEGIRRER